MKKLSIVVPTYRQEKTIRKNISILNRTLSKFHYNYEIVIVVDGFLDKTFDRALTKVSPRVRVLGYEKNLGKGYAVKTGMLAANGDIIGFIDGGMDVDPKGISVLLDQMVRSDADMVVGSKLHPDSKVNYPFARKILSRGYRILTHIMFGFDVRDTQVGLKIFKKQVARDIFPRLIVKKFAFDIEILAVAYARGYRKIIEAPIKIDFSKVSSITSSSFWGVVLRMLWDTAAVFYRLKILKYYDKMPQLR